MNLNDSKRMLVRLEEQLLTAPRHRIFGGRDWRANAPREPGVYVLWDTRTGKVVYVGQSGNLWYRLSDLGRCVNHTCRRKMAAMLNLPASDDKTLSNAIARRYAISYIEVFIGRAELEEYLILRWRANALNRRSPRLEKGTRYHWVETMKPPFFAWRGWSKSRKVS